MTCSGVSKKVKYTIPVVKTLWVKHCMPDEAKVEETCVQILYLYNQGNYWSSGSVGGGEGPDSS